jgi:hypothetical protein
MGFLTNIGIKLLISIVIAGISILSQLSSNEDILLADKVVVLGKSPSEIYKVLTALEEYSTVSNVTSKCLLLLEFKDYLI